ncbi:helix-turn-helix domain-containing protein [Thermoflavimicrobium daqui]|uniref:HTH cro/C1-type domain-containing protein n=1 Tax=Thermoflavimicrobium daqui TaxID=2137476 RepID=A0A364K3V4_9BACL|nr:XRE family transcriptional regulator [Thermoflavimicrobium daqui]RAL24042.1 hypothetical protein DL897_10090 [Thermoflavimicrobium daqui]
MDIGTKIKYFREQKGYSIREFAKLCHLSPSLISQVERNIASPSIASLVKMAEVLNCPVGSFFEDSPNHQIVVKKNERRKLILPYHKVDYELATPSQFDGEVRVLAITLPPKEYSSETKVSHQNKEICFVIAGSIQVLFEQTSYYLEVGDSISFDSSNSHQFFNPGSNEAQFLLIVYNKC